MPHKRNPILSERIAGLARLLRGYAQTGFENQPLWHERDISHSSAERVALPDATILLDYMLVRATGPGRRARGPAGADAREHRARPRPPRVVAGAAGARRARRAVARGRLRHRPAQRPAGRRTSACPLHRLLVDRPARGAEAAAGRARRLLRRRDAAAPRARRSSPASTRWRPSVRLAEAFVRSGKVRDLYRVGDDRLLLVASDRLSAFDVVLPTPIPDKGRVLTGLSRFWFARDRLDRPQPPAVDRPRRRPGATSPTATPTSSTTLRGRMMLGRLAEVLPIECVVRGYLSGSGWKAYLGDGAVCGIRLPAGLRESDRLPAPIFTPATKAPHGRARREHPVRERRDADRAGARGPGPRRRRSRCTRTAPRRASGPGSSSPTRSSSSALLPSGELLLIDEVMTPDSSRFWDATTYQPGRGAGELRQAVRPRLAAPAGLGPHRARPGAPARRRRRDPRPLRRRLRADHRRQLRPLSRRRT